MKKWFCSMLTTVLLLGLCPVGAMAEEPPVYKRGDKIEDFAVTLSDGTAVNFYELLGQKKAVLINLWASWCGPCRREFPFMQQVYDKYQKDVGILALSIEPTDTDEGLLALREDFGITTIPVGRDTVGLLKRFGVTAYPTSVMIDRNGIICYIESGSVPDAATFERLFELYIADDYAQPLLLEGMPALPAPEARPAEELKAALGITQEQITVKNVEDQKVWPFYASQDGACAQATNDAQQVDTIAGFTVSLTTTAGQALAFDYTVTGHEYLDSLIIYVDDQPSKFLSGAPEWRTGYVAFESEGEHAVDFCFNRIRSGLTAPADAQACIAKVRLIDADELASLEAAQPVYPKTLEGTEIQIELVSGDLKKARLYAVGGETELPIDVLQQGGLTHRIRVGKDVDPTRVMVGCDGRYHMLSNLSYDAEGFLMSNDGVEELNKELPVCHSIAIYPNAFNPAETAGTSVSWLNSEAEISSFITYIQQIYLLTQKVSMEFNWEYVDGTAKQGGESADAVADGLSRYVLSVQDESGAPIAGVMLQICDESTCAIAVSDASGTATHEAAPYPYEIHVLKAPEGYAADTATYVMQKEGGSLVITLNKQ